MIQLFEGLPTAIWLGILTSISPCPLATNIAAISFIARKVDKPAYALYAGAFYTLGRSITYIAIGILLVGSLLSAPVVSPWLQKYMYRLLGPMLILVGMVLLDMLAFRTSGNNLGRWCHQKAEKLGLLGALLLGFLFALSFCPFSAALFFGGLVPVSVKNGSAILLPLAYGIGTALPVFAFALFLSLGANSLAKAFEKVTQFEKWARRTTGIIFIAIGIYFTLAYTLAIKTG